jgi:hypothetical protein
VRVLVYPAEELYMSNAEKLVRLAKERFGSLSATEEEFFRKVGSGEAFNRSSGDAAADDPANSDQWGEERKLRSELLEWVCTDGEASGLVSRKGVEIIGVRFDDEVDLKYAQMGFPLFFSKCDFREEINLQMASLRSIYLGGSHTKNIDGDSLAVEGDLWLNAGFCAMGEVRFIGAKVGGDVICNKGKFLNAKGMSLNCDRIKVKGGVVLGDGFKAEGEVCFSGATVGRGLDCEKGNFNNPKGSALNCGGIKVKGSVFLRDKVRAEGGVRFSGAIVGGNFECDDSEFSNPKETAIECSGVEVKGSVFLRDGFKAEGEVRFLGATVRNGFDCGNGKFINLDGMALNCDGIEVKGNVFLRNGFSAKGKVNLSGATIAGGLAWMNVESPEKTEMDLRLARAGTLWDDEGSWPEKGKLFLDGFVYDEIYEKATKDAGNRLKWLGLQGGYSPGPYEQLAKVLGEGGHEDAAKRVQVAKNEEKARQGDLTLPEKIWYKVLGPMIGYGYRPLRVLYKGPCGVWIIGSILFWMVLGSVLFEMGYYGGSEIMVPSSARAYEASAAKVADADKCNGDVRDGYPTFQFITYSVDAFVPVVDLHQNKYWIPNANKGADIFTIGRYTIRTGGLLLFYLWLHIAAGWVLSTLFVVGLTGMVRK